MKIVFLDANTINPGDLSWDELTRLGEVNIYKRTMPQHIIDRCQNADIVITNKVIFSEEVLLQLPKLKCICVAATGFNVIDIVAARKRGIPVCNVVGYSTNSVAQHVFALVLALNHQVENHAQDVNNDGWKNSKDWSYQLNSNFELAGKTMGIYGFGKIGQKVGEIALAFGMNIISHHKHPKRDAKKGVKFVSLIELFAESDILSLHAPLTSENEGIVNLDNLRSMKSSSILINTGRGGLVVEKDLHYALEQGIIAGAGLDVISAEPPINGNILIGTKNCMITPHQAWAAKESRQRLLSEIVLNIKAFQKGQPRNVVNPK